MKRHVLSMALAAIIVGSGFLGSVGPQSQNCVWPGPYNGHAHKGAVHRVCRPSDLHRVVRA